VKLDLTGSGVLALAAVAAVGGLLLWKRKEIAAVAEAVNPASDQNHVNRGLSAVGEAVTGREGWSLGSQLADWFPSAAERELSRQWAAPPPATVDQAIMDANDARARRGTGAGIAPPAPPQSELDRLIEQGAIGWPMP
jgi:hypothetical protein